MVLAALASQPELADRIKVGGRADRPVRAVRTIQQLLQGPVAEGP